MVERKVKEEEVSSSTSLLKLDYQEIINAWPNKRPLFVDAEASSQIVPDIFHVTFSLSFSFSFFGDFDLCY